jgi:hypothetical protein
MISPVLDALLGKTLSGVVGRLAVVQREFGSTDFPGDNGIAYRNEFVKFALCAMDELTKYDQCEWLRKTQQLLETRTCDQLAELLGVLHFYSITDDACRRLIDESLLHIALDWIRNTYGSSGVAAGEWFELARCGTGLGHVQAREQKLLCEVAAILGTEPGDADDAKQWAAVAYAAQHMQGLDEHAHQSRCQKWFQSDKLDTDD